MLMAVKKTSAPPETPEQYRQRLDLKLERDFMQPWARWLSRKGVPEHHVRSKSIGRGYTHEDTDGAYDAMDLRNAQAVDAIVWHDLKAMERAALLAEYTDAIWTYEPINIHPVLVVAREAVRMALRQKGLWVEV